MKQRIACVRVPRRSIGDRAPAEAWARLAGALLAAAPRVTPVAEGAGGDAPFGAWADASGMERRGGDEAVARALLDAARSAGFEAARVGVAGTCVAAALATRERGSAWRVVPPGRDGSFVERRALALLPMPAELRASLELLGLRRCGDLGRLAAAEVELRFGMEGVRAWRLARGEDSRWPFRTAAPDRAVAEAELEPPLEGMEPLRFLLRGLVSSVVAQMALRQRVPAGLRLRLRLEGGAEAARMVHPARPTADERVLLDLCWSALESLASGGLGAPVAEVRLEGEEEGAARADQIDLFRPAAPDPAAVHAALLPLLGRWGEGALSRAAPRGAHLPAEQAVWEGWGARGVRELARGREPTEGAPAPPRPELPLCLRRHSVPEPVDVGTDDRGCPVSLRLGRSWHRLRAEGPERLSGRWWGEGYAREYWLVEDEDGCLRLLFRDGRAGAWRLEGWYD